MRLSTALKWTLLLATGATVLMWIAAIAFGMFAMQAQRFVGAAALLAGTSLMTLPCAICRDQARCRPLMLSGMIAAAASLIGWLWLVWLSGSIARATVEVAVRIISPFTVWGGLCMVVAVLIMRRLTSRPATMIFAATVAAAAGLGLVILSAVWFEDAWWRDGALLAKWLGVLGVLTVFGMLATLLVTRLHELEGATDEPVENVIRLDLTVICPRCGDRQPMQTGGDRCRHCGLHIKVVVP